MAFGKPCPYELCRDCDLDNSAEQYPSRVVPGKQRRLRGPGAAHHDEAGEPGKELRSVPCGYFPVLVRTENEVERGAGVHGLEPGEGVNRV